jgi:hypothetical protein
MSDPARARALAGEIAGRYASGTDDGSEHHDRYLSGAYGA